MDLLDQAAEVEETLEERLYREISVPQKDALTRDLNAIRLSRDMIQFQGSSRHREHVLPELLRTLARKYRLPLRIAL